MTTDFTPNVPSDRTSSTDDERIASVVPLPPPDSLIRFFPIEGTPAEELVARTRATVRGILDGRDDRLLVVVGPCSIHDPAAAIDYATRLAEVRTRLAADLEIVMRVYFEKPRTTVGWKGLINDPALDGTFRINEGLRVARDLLIRVNKLGVPAGCEFLDTISPQYIGDLVSWGAIGARTTESQVHRELASGLSAPIGFKNATDGDVQVAVDAILAAAIPHHFLSVHKNGQVAVVETRGNEACHVILRGGSAPNYDAAGVAGACRALAAAGLPERVMVDVSHANSGKKYDRQPAVAAAVAGQVAGGDRRIFGLMIESNLVAGRQELAPGKSLVYGQSVTDGCLGWDETVKVLDGLAEVVRTRRNRPRNGNPARD
ncbi:Phospho-2-dehydro-3-deoxyheptonate aldolase, Phe-sensitive [Gemmata sp. SH-PL17]|uniref:3-deoxy-7-phosphoheptulonate synthase n=1 Tax=Gemmata sp. SH-PL17 TaxID=1630693 RepID=UPI0004B844C5|nr:3-deoxy-7-phosphoheptulonate synthase [Gemmata sp. SH-PL17]AMV27430.1 Phospho-2-dehydro-3-deoxyheptonate aldolase, Phe-sensitive [Gemmata sp. SH-PL17]